MKRYSEYLNYIMECMAFLRGFRVRGMFGGYGLYQDELIFAIVVNDVLYLKSDAVMKHKFISRGLQPFTYAVRNRSVIMQYFEAPPDVFEKPEVMQEWTQMALDASFRAKKPPNKALQRTRKKPRAAEL